MSAASCGRKRIGFRVRRLGPDPPSSSVTIKKSLNFSKLLFTVHKMKIFVPLRSVLEERGRTKALRQADSSCDRVASRVADVGGH